MKPNKNFIVEKKNIKPLRQAVVQGQVCVVSDYDGRIYLPARSGWRRIDNGGYN